MFNKNRKNGEINIRVVDNHDKTPMYCIEKSRLGFTAMYITEHKQLRLSWQCVGKRSIRLINDVKIRGHGILDFNRVQTRESGCRNRYKFDKQLTYCLCLGVGLILIFL